MDLVQIRWQLIRSAEAGISIQQENVKLRQEIVQLKAQLAQAPTEKGIDKQFLDKIRMVIQTNSIRSRGEISKLKKSVTEEMTKLKGDLTFIQAAMGKLTNVIADQNTEMVVLKREKKQLIQQLENIQKDSDSTSGSLKTHLKEKDDLIASLKDDLKDLKGIKNRLEKSLSEEKEKNLTMSGEKVMLERRCQVCS
jgi:chromosome segregation ATPase